MLFRETTTLYIVRKQEIITFIERESMNTVMKMTQKIYVQRVMWVAVCITNTWIIASTEITMLHFHQQLATQKELGRKVTARRQQFQN